MLVEPHAIGWEVGRLAQEAARLYLPMDDRDLGGLAWSRDGPRRPLPRPPSPRPSSPRPSSPPPALSSSQ
jgi:hypothetical protein